MANTIDQTKLNRFRKLIGLSRDDAMRRLKEHHGNIADAYIAAEAEEEAEEIIIQDALSTAPHKDVKPAGTDENPHKGPKKVPTKAAGQSAGRAVVASNVPDKTDEERDRKPVSELPLRPKRTLRRPSWFAAGQSAGRAVIASNVPGETDEEKDRKPVSERPKRSLARPSWLADYGK